MFWRSTVSHSEWYVSAMEHLVEVVQDISHARDLNSIADVVRHAARELTGADGATFILRDEDKCYYADEDAISPLWKGQRFPMKTCISGWVMINAKPVMIEDIYKDPRIPIDAYRPTFVKSLAMVPIRKDSPVGAIGNYWAKNRTPTAEELSILQALADVTAVAMENVELYMRLKQKMVALEESNHELARFAWVASHDLKSPLRAIDNLSQWIAEDLSINSSSSAREHLHTLRNRVQRMENLLDDVLEYSTLESKLNKGDEKTINGATLIKSIPALLEVPAEFDIKYSDLFKYIKVPQLPLQRILCNLIDNAIKHHDKKEGVIEVSVDDFEDHYTFHVRDDGPGIAPEYREQIFEMFQTLQPRDVREGSGVGLAIVKKILTYYGGEISVSSTRGRGTTFTFTWPKSITTQEPANDE